MSNNSLVNLGELSKPATVLIEKISKLVESVAAPFQIRRVAKAEVEAAVIKAQSEIEITDLQRRAVQRWIGEVARHQKNMEDITAESIPHLSDDANPDAMDDDWIANFFDKCRIISDKEMQSLWSRVLAGEANTPGTYSKRTVNFVSELDKNDANLFTKLCRFCWNIGYMVPLVFDFDAEIYNRNGIDFDALRHLEGIGLIQWVPSGYFTEDKLPRIINACYYDKCLRLETPNDHYDYLEVGKILFTKVGEELSPICGSQPIDGFYEYVKGWWSRYVLADGND